MDNAKEDDTVIVFHVKPCYVTLFEEVFFYEVQHLEWSAAFVHKYQDSHVIISNEDLAQNEPVVLNLAVNFDVFYDEIFATTFPHRLNLPVSKRYSEAARLRLEALYDALRNDSLLASKVFEMAVEHGIKKVSWFQRQNDSTTVLSMQVAFKNTSVDWVNE